MKHTPWVSTSLVVTLLAVALLVGSAASLVVGASDQSATAVGQALLDGARHVFTGAPLPVDGLHTVVLNLRLPRLLLAILVGISLALAGAIMQSLFQNPMADPYIVGVSSGAGLGAVVAMLLGLQLSLLGLTAVPLLAFIGGLGIVLLVYLLSTQGGRVMTATLLLTGIAVGSLASSISALLMMTTDQALQGVLFWLMGGLSGRSWLDVVVMTPQTVLGLVGALLLARPLNLLLLGDDVAGSLGVNTPALKRWLLALSSLLAASSVAVGGIIAFVGLIVPHLSRLLVGPDHRRLLPVCALMGALLLVLADICARSLLAPTELPLGIITSALGCPFFLYLLHRHGRHGL